MFATGIENSIPTINQGKTRVDQMEVCGHYEHWREDFDAVQELGIHYLRYGPPLHRTFLGPNQYDWDFADKTFGELKRQTVVTFEREYLTQLLAGCGGNVSLAARQARKDRRDLRRLLRKHRLDPSEFARRA